VSKQKILPSRVLICKRNGGIIMSCPKPKLEPKRGGEKKKEKKKDKHQSENENQTKKHIASAAPNSISNATLHFPSYVSKSPQICGSIMILLASKWVHKESKASILQ
jgi:hypothetical protein